MQLPEKGKFQSGNNKSFCGRQVPSSFSLGLFRSYNIHIFLHLHRYTHRNLFLNLLPQIRWNLEGLSRLYHPLNGWKSKFAVLKTYATFYNHKTLHSVPRNQVIYTSPLSWLFQETSKCFHLYRRRRRHASPSILKGFGSKGAWVRWLVNHSWGTVTIPGMAV